MVPVKVRANAVLRWDNSHCQVSIPIPKPMPKWGIIKYARLGSKGNRSELAPIMQSASVTRNHLDETREWTITTHPIHSLTQSACTLTGNAGECRTCWKCSCQSDSLCCREWKQLLRSILIYESTLLEMQSLAHFPFRWLNLGNEPNGQERFEHGHGHRGHADDHYHKIQSVRLDSNTCFPATNLWSREHRRWLWFAGTFCRDGAVHSLATNWRPTIERLEYIKIRID